MWAGCEKYLVRALQVLQNQAARAVTGKSWFTPVRRLLKDCNWLSVNQPMFYTTVLQVHKVVNKDRPVYFQQRISTMHLYQTRQAAGGDIWHGESFQRAKDFAVEEPWPITVSLPTIEMLEVYRFSSTS